MEFSWWGELTASIETGVRRIREPCQKSWKQRSETIIHSKMHRKYIIKQVSVSINTNNALHYWQLHWHDSFKQEDSGIVTVRVQYYLDDSWKYLIL